jgi:hypothetical protein
VTTAVDSRANGIRTRRSAPNSESRFQNFRFGPLSCGSYASANFDTTYLCHQSTRVSPSEMTTELPRRQSDRLATSKLPISSQNRTSTSAFTRWDATVECGLTLMERLLPQFIPSHKNVVEIPSGRLIIKTSRSLPHLFELPSFRTPTVGRLVRPLGSRANYVLAEREL